jgi:hypothetical protein
MKKAKTEQQGGSSKRKVSLSPELNEFLHMLKALEVDQNLEPANDR